MSRTNHRHFKIADLELANDHHKIRVEVYYSTGGTSWFSGEYSGQGIWLSVHPMEIGGGFTSFTIGGGPKAYKGKLEDAARYNEKRLQTIADDLRANGEKSILFGAEYKRILDAVLEVNNFILATDEVEAYKTPTFAVGDKFKLVYTERDGTEKDQGEGVVVGVTYESLYGCEVYEAVMSDNWSRSYLKAVDHSTKMVSLGETLEPEAVETRIAECKAAYDERARVEEAKKAAQEAEFNAALADLKVRYPYAKQTGSRHARAAANCKAELEQVFPGVRFSVTTDTYSGGDSMNVRWTDGPKEEKVSKITAKYEDFDHMDVSDYCHTKNTAENKAARVHLGTCKYVNESREISTAALDAIRENVLAKYGEYPDRDRDFGAVSIAERSDIYGTFQCFFDLGKELSAIFEANTATAPALVAVDEDVQVTENTAKNGIEIRFNAKPEPETLEKIKRHGFRWSKFQKMWYAQVTDARREFAYSLTGQEVTA